MTPALNNGRHQRGRRAVVDEQLPPHSSEAEAGVLGCVLLDPTCVERVARVVGAEGMPFYVLAHRMVWQELYRMGCGVEVQSSKFKVQSQSVVPIEILTLQQRLKDRGELEQVGGVSFLAALPDAVPSAANLGHYLDIVREKYARRRLIEEALESVAQARDSVSIEALVAGAEARVESLRRLARDPAQVGRRLKQALEYGDEYWQSWFGGRAGEPGHRLPASAFGDFPFKIRERELTFVLGEKGAGKTNLISYIVLHLMRQGMKFAIASMEMHPADTLKILAAQLLGTTTLPDNAWGHAQARGAFDWLASRVRIYDFLGIAPWRELLDEMEGAAADGFNGFTIDSVMRLGILDDDYAEQGLCASRMAQFCMEGNAHVFLINHLNKGEKSRGSQQWIDNSHNVCAIRRNEKRAELLHKALTERDAGQLTQEEFARELEALNQAEKTGWMSKFELRNQRWSGSQQNASRYLMFERESLQLFDRRWTNPRVNWLEQWEPKKGKGKATTKDTKGHESEMPPAAGRSPDPIGSCGPAGGEAL